MDDSAIPEFDVIERDDGTWEARFTGTPATATADATAETFRELELACCAKRIVRAWNRASDPQGTEGTA
ncbi:hypothetical protein [Planomonospora algeriensis]